MNIVALIPARAGSKRIPGKNIKPLAGKPLIQWTVDAARESGVFSDIYVCADLPAPIVDGRGVAHMLRRKSSDTEPDITWVSDVLERLIGPPEAFAILRPTSPFRDAQAIRAAWEVFQDAQPIDSLRAVRHVTEHPGKMWLAQLPGTRMYPLFPYHQNDIPWHSSPTQALPVTYVQTAGLEIAWTRTVRNTGTISGTNVAPFLLEGWSAFDINTPDDWDRAEAHAQTLLARVP